MIEYLFTFLLVPLIPSLADPAANHAATLTTLEQRMNQGLQASSTVVDASLVMSEPVKLNTKVAELPPITGRMFGWSAPKSMGDQVESAELEKFVGSLRFAGEIESSGKRVAILNDGEQDHVVGVGSYVLGVYKVTSLGRGKVVLTPVDGWTGGKRLELNLMSGTERGSL